MPTLRAYYDESGHSRDTTHVGMGGLVIPASTHDDFEDAWRDMLQSTGIRELHMRQLAHSRGEYKGWTESQRRALLARALAIIADSGACALGTMLPMRLWTQLSELQQRGLVDPYYLCAQECFRDLAIQAALGGSRATVIVARNSEFAGKAGLLVSSMMARPELSAYIAEPFVFVEPRQHVGLQAADLVAYEFLLAVRSEESGTLPRRWPFLQLVKLPHRLHLISESYMRLKLPPDDILKRALDPEHPEH